MCPKTRRCIDALSFGDVEEMMKTHTPSCELGVGDFCHVMSTEKHPPLVDRPPPSPCPVFRFYSSL